MVKTFKFHVGRNTEVISAPTAEIIPTTIHPLDIEAYVKASYSDEFITLNPYHLSIAEFKNVFVWNKNGKRRLSDHPDYERWKDKLDAGEFWVSVGSDWF